MLHKQDKFCKANVKHLKESDTLYETVKRNRHELRMLSMNWPTKRNSPYLELT